MMRIQKGNTVGVKSLIATFSLVVSLGFAGSVLAQGSPQQSPSTPHEVITALTGKMMGVIEGGQEQLKEQPDKYYGEIRDVLEPNVSFGFIARTVMGPHWNRASEQQRNEFAEVFTVGMVETLGRGMANYSNLKIDTLPPQTGAGQDDKRVEVLQEIRGADGVNRVSYTMARNASGEWKLINVVLNGVNLGKSYRDQFSQAMRQHDNNIDKVISSWAS